MGMMIDEAIDRLEDLHLEQDDWECGELTEDCLLNREALRLAIETMQKYQRIIPVLVNYDLLNPIADVKTIDGEGIYINLSDLQDYIHKVVEDGNDKQRMS